MTSAPPVLPGSHTPWDLPLPEPFSLVVDEAVPVARRGPGGSDVFYWCRFGTGDVWLRMLVAQRGSLVAATVARLKQRLEAVIEEEGRRQSLTRGGVALEPGPVPAIITDAATSSVRDACVRHGLALLDKRGTIMIRSRSVIVHREGEGRVGPRERPPPFSGRASRIVRLVLGEPSEPLTARLVSKRARVAYAYTYAVMRRLEDDGFLVRHSPRSGFRTVDPIRLLREWMRSGYSSAAAVEGYYAPKTTPADLSGAYSACKRAEVRAIFTLAGALTPEELHVAALPHGMYVSGELAPIAAALDLRRTTPHNFLVLRAHPAVDTDAGGVYHDERSLPHGPAVALPQLILDLACHGGGRGKEQAESLLAAYARRLPFEVAT